MEKGRGCFFMWDSLLPTLPPLIKAQNQYWGVGEEMCWERYDGEKKGEDGAASTAKEDSDGVSVSLIFSPNAMVWSVTSSLVRASFLPGATCFLGLLRASW